jgi:putative transcriptional regulator
MATVRKTLADIRATPRKLTLEEATRLDAMTDRDITTAAESDPDNPPLGEDELLKVFVGGIVRRARKRTKLTQREFAERYHLNLRRLQDLEQGRTAPDSALEAYLRVIEKEPELVERIINAA